MPRNETLRFRALLHSPVKSQSHIQELRAAHKFALKDGAFPMPAETTDKSGVEPTNSGIGSKWFVKGGNFAFRVIVDIALSSFTLAMSEASIEAAKDNTKTASSIVYARPMHLTKGNDIESVLAVKVVRKYTDGTIETIDNSRAVDFVYKPVPTALWDPYNEAEDPKHKPASLLNADNPTFKPPLPTLSPPVSLDGYKFSVTKFKATAAAKFGLLDFREAGKEAGQKGEDIPADKESGTDWFVAKSVDKQGQYQPRALSDEENKQAARPRWDNTRSTWDSFAAKTPMVNSTKPGAGDGFLGLVAKTLG